MLSFISSTIFTTLIGVLAGKVFNKKTRLGKISPLVEVLLWIIMFLVALWLSSSQTDSPLSMIDAWISNLRSNTESNLVSQLLQLLLLFLPAVFVRSLIGLIDFLERPKNRALSFKEYSKQIVAFTKNVKENSVLTIVAGDMDFFGGVKVGDIEPTNPMDKNPEYKQLQNFSKKVSGFKIRILCSHGLDGEPQLLQSILGHANPEFVYKYRNTRNDHTFQQLLRIGKIKDELKNVDIRFYPSGSDDKHLRARFIDESGIIYRNEGVLPNVRRWRRKKGFPFIELYTPTEKLYTVRNLDKDEWRDYNELFKLKWEDCEKNAVDKSKGNTILSFCESLYRFVADRGPRFRMALVYANSYEIARKGVHRKEFPPFGVMYLAACVEERNQDWKVDIIPVDKNMSTKKLDWSDYDVIGLSLISSYSYDVLKRCFNASERRKEATIIAGGYQAEKFVHKVFEDFKADIVFKGEGEEPIVAFCQHYEDRNYEEIPGIIYRDSSRRFQATKGRGCVDIDKIPLPARRLLDDEDIVMTDRLAGTDLRMVHMLFSRGCIYNCVYCAANQDKKVKHIRYRNKQNIVNELTNLIDVYDIEGFSIIDDCFLTEKDRAIEICEYIAQETPNLKWSLAARVDQIDDDILKALKLAGCIEIKFGVETGSDKLLQEMSKNTTVAMAEEAIRKTKDYGIGVKLFIITGLPRENDTTHNETKEFLGRMHREKLVDRVSLLRYTPLAGSYIYSNPAEFGIKEAALSPDNFSKTHLYHKSHDWWVEADRFKNCERWYKDMKAFIEKRWGDA